MAKQRRLPKVHYKKLIKAWGYAHLEKNYIELSVSLRGRKHLEILIHEHLHILLPAYDEEYIVEMSKEMSKLLIKEGYHRGT